KITVKINNESKNAASRKYPSIINLRIISAAACIALLITISTIILPDNEEPKFIANVNTNETEVLQMLENSFTKISGVVDDAVALLDITSEQVCEIDEELNNL
ncbi:MAG: hypothetical protein LBT56_06750, partial [Prevotellaceae bacterium]|nr:hypothetical protein [Prevotellaceae bacterium]